MNWNEIVMKALPVWGQGLVLSLGLIVAIGAQNAFVLRQGLRREHVGIHEQNASIRFKVWQR